MHSNPGDSTRAHYDRLAASYDANWAYSPAYIEWMTGCLLSRARLTHGDVIADIGCGTGLYSRGLAAAGARVICADPSSAMLAQLPGGDEYLPVQASAEAIATGRVTLPVSSLNAIVIKEAVHHIPAADRPHVLTGLTRLLTPGGRIIIAMLPEQISHPLFTGARRLFEQRQPRPAGIAAMLTHAGLRVQLTYEEFPLRFARDRYLNMVRNRYMSLLSEFTDADIEDGIAEIADAHPSPDLAFTDRFAFITGQI